ncbi:Gfo/Idh/MocA family protein [Bifidobacterium stellenboschense]|uniref:Putative oxidoreductase n=1 Tax=Bifidobacterium stellenboschense TaxID=762211 RepID=A0A087DI98_9BIFI|nr:Gfo/Idh/MocA family oxidoreductase [Bifidobacterium stellenboschense]KFI95248.1 putative oxidoreductase [Bifidobacterium stellenboschense]
MRELKWATLGCGVIANQLEQALEQSGRKLYAVANRTHAKGVAFAEKYGIGKVYDEIDDVFADPDVDVIYISTPHNTHIGFLRKALAAGKHVLCEKSITLNSGELDEAIALAEANHVLLAEAMTLYHMPLYRELDRIIAGGELGKVKLIQMNFGSYKEYDMANRFFNRNLAGGAMLDIGVYALSCMRWFMSSKPDRIVSQVKAAPTGVDEQAGILLTNPDGRWPRSRCRCTRSSRSAAPSRSRTAMWRSSTIRAANAPRSTTRPARWCARSRRAIPRTRSPTRWRTWRPQSPRTRRAGPGRFRPMRPPRRSKASCTSVTRAT